MAGHKSIFLEPEVLAALITSFFVLLAASVFPLIKYNKDRDLERIKNKENVARAFASNITMASAFLERMRLIDCSAGIMTDTQKAIESTKLKETLFIKLCSLETPPEVACDQIGIAFGGQIARDAETYKQLYLALDDEENWFTNKDGTSCEMLPNIAEKTKVLLKLYDKLICQMNNELKKEAETTDGGSNLKKCE